MKNEFSHALQLAFRFYLPTELGDGRGELATLLCWLGPSLRFAIPCNIGMKRK
jgi:hypothetical protein